MSIKINVEPHMLETCAQRMEEHCGEYEKTYRQMYQVMEGMSASWQGSDHMAYVNQIQGFQNDFIQMTRLLRQYIEFLGQSARAYRMAQEDRVAKARTLTN